MKAERRIAERKSTEHIEVTELTSLLQYRVIARAAKIIDVSTSGMMMVLDRKDLVPKDLRDNLTLKELLGQHVVMYLPQMNLDLDGRIIRADHVGKGLFEIGLQFSEEVPLYWRECLIDLLPTPGEFEDGDD